MGEGESPPDDIGVWAHDRILTQLSSDDHGWFAPPEFDRLIDVQETETILCKWKSYLGGHYEIGKDTREIEERLKTSKTRIGKQLYKAGKGQLW